MNEKATFATELKFVVDETMADGIRKWMRGELAADPHAVGDFGDGYQTTTLYFDTEHFDLFFRRRSYARAKFRIRRYNDGNTVFLERKMKVEGRVSKRRSHCALEDLLRLSNLPAQGTDWSGVWFARRLENRRLQPVCQTTYNRTARIGMSDNGPIRLTLDTNLQAAEIDAIRFADAVNRELAPGSAILEMKYRIHVPLVFKRFIEEFGLAPRSHSKYRAAIKVLGLVPKEERLKAGA